MPSNLPPGCTSADGGIDHAMESALETLCNAVETFEGAHTLILLAPTVERVLADRYKQGYADAKFELSADHT